MAFSKVFALIAFVVVAQAQVIPVPVSVKGTDAEYDPHPQYNFEYSVHDPITGDNKAQQESRDGDVVQGSYSLVEADGSLRTVQYTADAVSGFNAVVSRSGEAVASPAVPALAPVIAAKVAPVPYLKAAPTVVIRTQAAPTAVIRTQAAPTAVIRTSLSPAPIYPYKSSATLLPYTSYPYNTYPHASLRYTGYPSRYLSGNPSAYLSGYPSGYPYSAYPSHGYSAPVSTY